MQPERWKRLSENRFAVEISEETNLSAASLMYFMRKIPFAIRKEFKKIEWAGDYEEYGKRFGIITAEIKDSGKQR